MTPQKTSCNLNLEADIMLPFDGCRNPSESLRTNFNPFVPRIPRSLPQGLSNTNGCFISIHRSAVGILRTALPKTRACLQTTVAGGGKCRVAEKATLNKSDRVPLGSSLSMGDGRGFALNWVLLFKPMSSKQAYQLYLQSEHWKNLRAFALSRDNYRCQRCFDCRTLQVHHKIYRDKWEDSVLEDLVTLCDRCHKFAHGFKVKPVKERQTKKKRKRSRNNNSEERRERRLKHARERIKALTYLFGNNPVEIK